MAKEFIKVDRAVFETELMADPLAFRLYMLIAKEAVFSNEYTIEGIKLTRGQWIRSYRKLAEDLQYKERCGYKNPAISTIKRTLQTLFDFGLITFYETRKGTLITLVNLQADQAVSHSDEFQEKHSSNDNTNVNETPNSDLSKQNKELDLKELKELKKDLKDNYLVNAPENLESDSVDQEITKIDADMKQALEENQSEQHFSFFNIAMDDLNANNPIPVNVTVQRLDPFDWLDSHENNPPVSTDNDILDDKAMLAAYKAQTA